MKKDKEKACTIPLLAFLSGYRQVASQLTSTEWLTPKSVNLHTACCQLLNIGGSPIEREQEQKAQ
ncbi:MAG: hypothetical protein PUE17_07865 [Bacteroidales bacterium]|nr:hypothetical protein [Bacteroidales bacterium]